MRNVWTTFDDRTVEMKKMEHQHMSNIWYYITKVVPQLYNDSTRTYIKSWLDKRFDGVILPYHPHPDFKNEKMYLEHKGWIQSNGDIVINNIKIGSYDRQG